MKLPPPGHCACCGEPVMQPGLELCDPCAELLTELPEESDLNTEIDHA
jgi:hypothetical protein